MKKYVAICSTLAALAWAGVAAASVPPQLTGSSSLAASTWAVGDGIVDGGTDPLYIGKENDKSTTDKCAGDDGTFILNGQAPLDVVCAHWVQHSGRYNTGSPKMRFAFQTPPPFNTYVVVRITDNGVEKDSYGTGFASSLDDAIAWVNTGAVGSGHPFDAWSLVTVTEGDYQITP